MFEGSIRDFPITGAFEQTPCCESDCQVTMATFSPPLVRNVCRRGAAIGRREEPVADKMAMLQMVKVTCTKGQ